MIFPLIQEQLDPQKTVLKDWVIYLLLDDKGRPTTEAHLVGTVVSGDPRSHTVGEVISTQPLIDIQEGWVRTRQVRFYTTGPGREKWVLKTYYESEKKMHCWPEW